MIISNKEQGWKLVLSCKLGGLTGKVGTTLLIEGMCQSVLFVGHGLNYLLTLMNVETGCILNCLKQ